MKKLSTNTLHKMVELIAKSEHLKNSKVKVQK
jgi:hypothetical protein